MRTDYPPAPACQGPSGCEAYGSNHRILQPFQTFNMSTYNFSKSSKLVSFQHVDLIVYSFQQSVVVSCVPQGINLFPSTARGAGFWRQAASKQPAASSQQQPAASSNSNSRNHNNHNHQAQQERQSNHNNP